MRHRALLSFLPLLLACGSSSSPQSVPSGSATAHPPADPGGPPPAASAASDVAVFAIRKLYVGDADPVTGQLDTSAWGRIGFDIDGKDTTMQSTDVCTLATGAPIETQQDGEGGIDNAFGSQVVPILQGLFGEDMSLGLDGTIEAGLVTDLIVVKGLGSTATTSPLQASIFVAAPLGQAPTWSMADTWPIDASSVRGGDAASPLLTFARSYVADNVFVAEPPAASGEIALGVLNNAPFVLPIRHLQVQMTLSPDGMTATRGVLSGILPTDRLLALVGALTAQWGPCSDAQAASVAGTVQNELAQAQDVLLDGANAAGSPCSGISIGLAFEAVRVQMGAVTEVSRLPTACGDAGTDGGP
jgi:hypothetical protein